MGLASKLSGYKPSGQSAGSAPPVQQQGNPPGGGGYPPSQNSQGNFYPSPGGYGQESGGNQASHGPPQQTGGFPKIQSGLNSSFQAGGQPSQVLSCNMKSGLEGTRCRHLCILYISSVHHSNSTGVTATRSSCMRQLSG